MSQLYLSRMIRRPLPKNGYTYRAGGDLQASHNLVSYAEAKEKGNESAMGSYWSDGTGRLAGTRVLGDDGIALLQARPTDVHLLPLFAFQRTE